jgi:hypothetical protein
VRRFSGGPNEIEVSYRHRGQAALTNDWSGPRPKNFLVVFIGAITRNGLATATRTRLQVAAKLMKFVPWHSAVVALGMIEIVFALAIQHSIEHP